jgi:hypothetical protein
VFVETIKSAKYVFFLYFSLIIVASGMGHILFRKFLNVEVIENSWKSFIRSFITAFVFISTGDNFVDNVYPVAEFRPVWVVYFLIFTVFGTIFIMALVLSVFQDGFTESLRSRMKLNKIKDRLCMIGTFILIDIDDSGTVDLSEFSQFVKEVNPLMSSQDIDRTFFALNISKEVNQELNIKDFLLGIEECTSTIQNLSFEVLNYRDYLRDDESLKSEFAFQRFLRYIEIIRWILCPIISSHFFDLFVLICIIFQVFILSAYGTVDNLYNLDVANFILVLVNFFDVFLKIFVFRGAVIFFILLHFLDIAFF